jgi:hypothetical protein
MTYDHELAVGETLRRISTHRHEVIAKTANRHPGQPGIPTVSSHIVQEHVVTGCSERFG